MNVFKGKKKNRYTRADLFKCLHLTGYCSEAFSVRDINRLSQVFLELVPFGISSHHMIAQRQLCEYSMNHKPSLDWKKIIKT